MNQEINYPTALGSDAAEIFVQQNVSSRKSWNGDLKILWKSS